MINDHQLKWTLWTRFSSMNSQPLIHTFWILLSYYAKQLVVNTISCADFPSGLRQQGQCHSHGVPDPCYSTRRVRGKVRHRRDFYTHGKNKGVVDTFWIPSWCQSHSLWKWRQGFTSKTRRDWGFTACMFFSPHLFIQLNLQHVNIKISKYLQHKTYKLPFNV